MESDSAVKLRNVELYMVVPRNFLDLKVRGMGREAVGIINQNGIITHVRFLDGTC